MAALYTGYGIYLQTDLGGPTLIGGISKQSIKSGVKAGHEVSAGSYYPMIATIHDQHPIADFTTRAIEVLLGRVLPPVVALDGIGCECYQVQKAESVIDSGSVHRKWAIASGVVVPQKLTCQQGNSAEMSCQVLSRSPSGSAPLAPTETVALPSTLTDASRFSMGTMTLGGITIDGKTSLEIDFGVKAEQVGVDGAVWAQWIDVADYLAKITIKSVNTALVAAAGIPLLGKAGTHANTVFYLRKRDGAGFAAGGVHIKVTADGLAYADDIFDGSGNDKGECSVVLLCRYDGVNAPIDFALSQSLP